MDIRGQHRNVARKVSIGNFAFVHLFLQARRAGDSVAPFAMKLIKLDDCEDGKVVRLCRTQASSHNSQDVVDAGVDKAGMSTAAPGRSAVLCG